MLLGVMGVRAYSKITQRNRKMGEKKMPRLVEM
jgi:hypothetical protein